LSFFSLNQRDVWNSILRMKAILTTLVLFSALGIFTGCGVNEEKHKAVAQAAQAAEAAAQAQRQAEATQIQADIQAQMAGAARTAARSSYVTGEGDSPDIAYAVAKSKLPAGATEVREEHYTAYNGWTSGNSIRAYISKVYYH
jgi:hypothetical protein